MLPDVVRGESIVNMSQIKHLTDVANPPQRHRRVTGSAIWYKSARGAYVKRQKKRLAAPKKEEAVN